MLWNLENVQELGFWPYVGPGTSINYLVHVDDVVNLIILVFQKELDTCKPEDAYSSVYIAVNEAPEATNIA